jgi:hypothetical protein
MYYEKRYKKHTQSHVEPVRCIPKSQKCNYVDQASAKIKQGTAKKLAFTESSFLILLEYGANNEGCWTYESMVMQLEDCVNCLQVLHSNFDFVFIQLLEWS